MRGALRRLAAGALGIIGLLAGGLRAADSPEHRIVFFGDSLTAGYGLEDPSAQAYPAIIQKKIDHADLPWRVVNAGLSGETSAGGLRRVDWILRQPADAAPHDDHFHVRVFCEDPDRLEGCLDRAPFWEYHEPAWSRTNSFRTRR